MGSKSSKPTANRATIPKPPIATRFWSLRNESSRFPATGADYCLISADGVAFGFTEAQLCQSTVLWDMVNPSEPETDVNAVHSEVEIPNVTPAKGATAITFVDTDIETSNELELLLCLLSGDRMDRLNPHDRPLISVLTATILFAKKYEFTQIYRQCIEMCSTLHKQLSPKSIRTELYSEAVDIFCLAARLDEELLALEAVTALANRRLPQEGRPGVRERAKDMGGHMTYRCNGTALDFSSWPVDAIQHVPIVYAYALARAARPEVYMAKHEFYSTNAGDRFLHFLALAKKGVRV